MGMRKNAERGMSSMAREYPFISMGIVSGTNGQMIAARSRHVISARRTEFILSLATPQKSVEQMLTKLFME